MSDDRESAAVAPETTANTQSETDGGATVNSGPTSTESTRDIGRLVNYAVLAGLCLLAFVAAFQFYFSALQVIDIWVTREYRPMFRAVFNLAVVLLAGAGITLQLRRLYG